MKWCADGVSNNGSLIFTDSSGLVFGTECDAVICYDGSDLKVNPQAVGSGNFIISAGKVGIGTDQDGCAILQTGSGTNSANACVVFNVCDTEVGLDVTAGTVHVGTWALA